MPLARYRIAREKMVALLEAKGVVRSEPVRRALMAVPRERFVAEAWAGRCYIDDALPIGNGQTISKPSIVAQMLEALDASGRVVLEVGTGSGYTTAVVAAIAAKVFTVERHRSLGLQAKRILQSLGIVNFEYKSADGSAGWPGNAPFERILVTAEAETVPPELVAQLSPGGKMVIPLKGRLCIVRRDGAGHQVDDLGPARFVPLVQGVKR